MQNRLFKSVRAAISLSEANIFNAVLADKSFQEWILNLNKSQLFDGEDSLGVKLSDIGGGYSFNTEFLSGGRSFTFDGNSKSKKAGQSPFLLDTGEYYSSFRLELGNDFFKINSNPQKEDTNLEEEWGGNLAGLQDENLQKIIDVIRKKFIQETRSKISG